MPVFISEIVFHGRVGGGGAQRPEAERTPVQRMEDRDQLVEDCVAEVMRLLRRAGER